MAFITERDRKGIQDRLKALDNPVRLINFTQELECQFCRETRQLATELAELSEKLTVDVYNFQIDKDRVDQYRIDKIPAIVVEGTKDYGIRYYGIPAGYEFASLLETTVRVSQGDSGLTPESREKIGRLDQPVHIQVFVTPTCPYCPVAVVTAHKLAVESDLITADMVETTEFPHLAVRYTVRGVPKIIVNETIHFEGALPEHVFVQEVVKALEADTCGGGAETSQEGKT